MLFCVKHLKEVRRIIKTMTIQKSNSSCSCCAGILQECIPLADKNWFCTGGHARYYSEPKTAAEFKEVLNWALNFQCPIHVLGSGANSLISDEGFNGLIIKPLMADVSIVECAQDMVLVTAGAGIGMTDLISYCLKNRIIGLEELSGIPGTVGGSVYNNLHYFEYSLSDFLESATVIEKISGQTTTVDKAWLSLGYDNSRLHEKQYYLVDATFRLRRVSELDAAYAQGRSAEIARHRQKRYPTSNTCGCFFRNFHDNEITMLINGKKLPYVAYYLDAVGIKGSLRIGNAQVSHQHANMIVTTPGATTADIVAVAITMQEKVYKKFGLMPKAECELIGFSSYPLLT